MSKLRASATEFFCSPVFFNLRLDIRIAIFVFNLHHSHLFPCSHLYREAILAASKTVHHDFGVFNQSLAVSLTASNLEEIKKNSNVDWFEGDGRVIYCSIR